MGLFSKLVAVFVVASLVMTSEGLAIGFSCKYLLQNDFVTKTVEGAKKVAGATGTGLAAVWRNFRPSRLFYRNLNADEVQRVVRKYQGNGGAITQFELDLKARASSPEQNFTPEEFFALDILRRPLEGRELINEMIANEFIWVRKRFGFQEALSKDQPAVSQNSKSFVKRFSFPKSVAKKDFRDTSVSLIVAIAQSDFADPVDFEVFAGPWEEYYKPLIDHWAEKKYHDGFASLAFRNFAYTLSKILLKNKALRAKWLLDFRDHIKDPQKINKRLDDLSPEAKQVYEKLGETGLLNYLITHEGLKKSAFWFGRLLMIIIASTAAGHTIWSYFIAKNGLNLQKGKGLSTDDSHSRKIIMCDFTEEDENMKSGRFDPTDPLIIGKLDFKSSNPAKDAKATPCDPRHSVVTEYIGFRGQRTDQEWSEIMDNPAFVISRDKKYDSWRTSILGFWNDKNSGCQSYYHEELQKSDCNPASDEAVKAPEPSAEQE